MTGEELRTARLSLGLSYRDLAVELGLSASSRRNVRRYEVAGPPAAMAEKVEELLRRQAQKKGSPEGLPGMERREA